MLLARDKCFAGLSVECPGHCDLPGPYSPGAMIPHFYCSPFLISSNEFDSPRPGLTKTISWSEAASGGRRTYSIAQRGCSKTDNVWTTVSELASRSPTPLACNNHNLLMKLVFTLTPAIQYKIFFPPGRRKQRDFVLFRDLSINNLTSHFPILIFGHIN